MDLYELESSFLLIKKIVGKRKMVEGVKHRVYIKFEKFPLLCFICEQWGHGDIECKLEQVLVDDGYGGLMNPYEPLLTLKVF